MVDQTEKNNPLKGANTTMMNWLSLSWASLLVGFAVVAVLATLGAKMIRDKKNNKSACGCSCSGCQGASYCHKGLSA